MATDWVNIVSAVGFPIVLVLLGLNFITKHLPTFLEEWRRFTVANEHFAKAVEQNTVKTTSVEDHLKEAIRLLQDHHDNAEGIDNKIVEVQSLLIELAEEIQSLRKDMWKIF